MKLIKLKENAGLKWKTCVPSQMFLLYLDPNLLFSRFATSFLFRIQDDTLMALETFVI